MKIKFTNLGRLFKTAFKKWWERDPFRQSSIIAYNAIFSLPGLLVVVVTLAGYFFGTDAVNGHLHSQIASAMGPDTADSVQGMIKMAMTSKNSSIASVLGIVTILIGATGVFIEMQKSLNIIWEVKATTKKSGLITFLKTRLFSFGLILTIAFLLLMSLLLSSILTLLSSWVQEHWSVSLLVLFEILNSLLSLVIITSLFAMMFKIMPDAKIKWRSVWIGAFITSVLFTLGKSALGLYFGTANPGSTYGAAGSVVLILLWASYSSLIVFYGAEFTKAYSDFHIGNIPASETAVKDKGRVK